MNIGQRTTGPENLAEHLRGAALCNDSGTLRFDLTILPELNYGPTPLSTSSPGQMKKSFIPELTAEQAGERENRYSLRSSLRIESTTSSCFSPVRSFFNRRSAAPTTS